MDAWLSKAAISSVRDFPWFEDRDDTPASLVELVEVLAGHVRPRLHPVPEPSSAATRLSCCKAACQHCSRARRPECRLTPWRHVQGMTRRTGLRR